MYLRHHSHALPPPLPPHPRRLPQVSLSAPTRSLILNGALVRCIDCGMISAGLVQEVLTCDCFGWQWCSSAGRGWSQAADSMPPRLRALRVRESISRRAGEAGCAPSPRCFLMAALHAAWPVPAPSPPPALPPTPVAAAVVLAAAAGAAAPLPSGACRLRAWAMRTACMARYVAPAIASDAATRRACSRCRAAFGGR